MNPTKDDRIPLERIARLCRDLLTRRKDLDSDDDFAKETDAAKIVSFDFIQISETFDHLNPAIKKEFGTVNEATVKGMRNVLVHDYGRIEEPIIRMTLDRDIDSLLQETLRIIEKLSGQKLEDKRTK
jgi:uncharacterized protein with HEPN domain